VRLPPLDGNIRPVGVISHLDNIMKSWIDIPQWSLAMSESLEKTPKFFESFKKFGGH
jgi:hypothetical protein